MTGMAKIERSLWFKAATLLFSSQNKPAGKTAGYRFLVVSRLCFA
jgi:hypothetical protein